MSYDELSGRRAPSSKRPRLDSSSGDTSGECYNNKETRLEQQQHYSKSCGWEKCEEINFADFRDL